jgi:hypothetical protein
VLGEKGAGFLKVFMLDYSFVKSPRWSIFTGVQLVSHFCKRLQPRQQFRIRQGKPVAFFREGGVKIGADVANGARATGIFRPST